MAAPCLKDRPERLIDHRLPSHDVGTSITTPLLTGRVSILMAMAEGEHLRAEAGAPYAVSGLLTVIGNRLTIGGACNNGIFITPARQYGLLAVPPIDSRPATLLTFS